MVFSSLLALKVCLANFDENSAVLKFRTHLKINGDC